jgi:hypothetical protein
MERETGFEPATSTLARSHSTTELLPLNKQKRFIYLTVKFVNIKFAFFEFYIKPAKTNLPALSVLFIPVCHKGINSFVCHVMGCKFF